MHGQKLLLPTDKRSKKSACQLTRAKTLALYRSHQLFQGLSCHPPRLEAIRQDCVLTVPELTKLHYATCQNSHSPTHNYHMHPHTHARPLKHHSLTNVASSEQYGLDGKQITSLHTDALT
jgi:hypothetical protein